MPSALVSLLLLVLTRDGMVHRLDPVAVHDSTQPAAGASALASWDGHVAILAGGRLRVDGRAVPGRFADVRALAGAARLWLLGRDGADAVEVQTGRRTSVLRVPDARHLAADGDAVFVEAAGVVHARDRQWKLPAPAVALAAGAGKLWAIVGRDGQLWELDRATGQQRPLGLGSWSGVLGFAYGDGQLWVATVAGKLWRIDPATRRKTIVAMDGWQGTIDLTVLR